MPGGVPEDRKHDEEAEKGRGQHDEGEHGDERSPRDHRPRTALDRLEADDHDAALRKLDGMERSIKRLDGKYETALTRINQEFEPEVARLNDAIAAAMQRSPSEPAANQNG